MIEASSKTGHKIKAVIGLGNPGKKYELTRHNLGYLVVQEFAAIKGWGFKEEQTFHAKVATGLFLETKIHLLLPTTYMNESGQAVKRFLDFYKLEIDELLIVSDDVALPFGEMRFRDSGSSGGHNGLKSIEKHLSSSSYRRLRMGISSNFTAGMLADYVLETFREEELKKLPEFVQKGALKLEQLMTGFNTLENKI